MANGIRAFRKLQLARNADSDSDDIVAATTILRANGTIEDTRNLYFVSEDVGIATGTDRTNTSLYGGKLSVDPIEATYEQFPHFLEMSIQAATPSFDSGDVYVWNYPIPTTSFNALKYYTLEGGDNAGAEVVNYVSCMDWTLSGKGGEAWMMSANLFGKQVQPQAFSGGATLPSVNTANFSQSFFYIDADSDTWGTTLVSNTLLAATLKYNAKLVAKPAANGTLTYAYVVQTQPDITLSVTFEHNAGAITEKANWRAETPRLIRLLNQGPAFTNPGNTYTKRSIIADLAGKWLKFNKIGEQNGNDVLEGTFQVRYNATQASAGNIAVVNALASLP